MGNLGFTEIMIILVVVLLVFGAKRLPEIGASIGKGIREFKRSISEAGDAVTSFPDDRNAPPRHMDAPPPIGSDQRRAQAALAVARPRANQAVRPRPDRRVVSGASPGSGPGRRRGRRGLRVGRVDLRSGDPRSWRWPAAR